MRADSTNGSVNGTKGGGGGGSAKQSDVVAVVELAQVPRIVDAVLETLERRLSPPGKRARMRVYAVPASMEDHVSEGALKARIAEKHSRGIGQAPTLDPTRARRVERSRRRRGQMMRHRYETTAGELRAARERIVELEKQLRKAAGK